MVRKIKKQSLNRELVRQSLLSALQESYRQLKMAKVHYETAWWINQHGVVCCLGDSKDYANKITLAHDEYKRMRSRYDGYVDLVEKNATDDELVYFLENGYVR